MRDPETAFDFETHQLIPARLKFFSLVSALALTIIFSSSIATAFLAARQKPAVAQPATTPSSAEQAKIPFTIGESLEYKLSWLTFATAANITLAVVEQRDLYGWNVLHFRAAATTLPPLRSLFAIDDQFDSYSEIATFTSRQYETYLDELGREQTLRMELTPMGAVPRGQVASVIVPPDTRDPLGLLQSLRAHDWLANPEIRASVFDSSDLYEIRASRDSGPLQVSVPAGSYDTDHISIDCFNSGKRMEKVHFEVWISRDPARMPVRMRAELPLGTFLVEMTGHSQARGRGKAN